MRIVMACGAAQVLLVKPGTGVAEGMIVGNEMARPAPLAALR
jgi:methylaspartate ammonia-lyase